MPLFFAENGTSHKSLRCDPANQLSLKRNILLLIKIKETRTEYLFFLFLFLLWSKTARQFCILQVLYPLDLEKLLTEPQFPHL